MIFASLLMKLGYDTSGLNAGKQQAVNSLKDVDKQTKSTLATLNDAFGKRSLLGQGLKLAAGKGALGALSAAGREAKEFINGMNELNAAYHRGEISSGQYGQKIMETLPVLGQWFQLGEAIGKSLSREAQSIAKVTAELHENAAIFDKAAKSQMAFQKQTKELSASLDQQKKKLENSTALSRVDDDDERQILATKQEAADAIDELHDKVKKEINQTLIDSLEANFKHVMSLPTSSKSNAILGGINLQLKQLNKDKELLLKQQADVEEKMATETAEKISALKRKADKEDAKKAIEVEKEKRDKVLEGMQKEVTEELKTLKEKRKKLLQDGDDKSYKSTSVSQVRSASIALYAPQVGNKIEQLSEDQVKVLKSIDDKIEKLTGVRPSQNDDDVIVDF